MDTFQLDTLNWVRLRCAACGNSVEILQLDLESPGSERIVSPCCGARLAETDAKSSRAQTSNAESNIVAETPNVRLTNTPGTSRPAATTSVPDDAAPSVDDRKQRPQPLRIAAVSADNDDGSEARAGAWNDPRRDSAGIVTSIAVHALLLAVLAATVLRLPPRVATDVLNLSFDAAANDLTADATPHAVTLDETIELSLPDVQKTEPLQPVAVEELTARQEASLTETSPSSEASGDTLSAKNNLGLANREVTANSGVRSGSSTESSGSAKSGSTNSEALTDDWSIPSGRGFPTRRLQNRRRIAALTGATAASEAAVEAGLKWLADHQREDGSWSLQHSHAECHDACLPDSSMDCPTAATGLALLCYLGAGHSHREGDYQQVVQRGIDWLVSQSRDGDLRTSVEHVVPEGRSGMYAHGIAAMALCEAYGLTLDRTLIQACEESIEFIAESQDPVGGGWRYSPGDAGDTSVVGWQVMTLVSARLSGLKVPNEVRERAIHFLRSVHLPSTGEYGYKQPVRGTVATTAIGSLCSLYLHSSLDRVRLQRVGQLLGTQDPKSSNEYANYYVSLVLHHLGGDRWRVWNAAYRDMLVNSQVKHGHAAGSWDPISNWGRSGGRLYSTCMNVLTLEVYYRHLPLYADDAFEIGLAAKPVPRRQTPKTKASSGRAGKQAAAASEFVPIATDGPIAIPGGELVFDVPQHPLGITPSEQPQSLFPRATRFSPPLRKLFDEAALRSVKDGDGREWRLYPDAGFGMPLIKAGEQTLVQTGSDFGWFQPGEPVFAAAAGIVRYSGGPARDDRPSTEKLDDSRSGSAAAWGHTIVIEHVLPDETSLTTIYAHLGDNRQVEAGDVVESGQQIASIGSQNEMVNGGCVPHLFFAVHVGSPGAQPNQLAGFATDTNGWLNPVTFLREQQTDILPAVLFSPTWNPFPRSASNVIGQPAREWPATEWIRESRHGRTIAAMRGKTICLVCVQASCAASRQLGGLLLSDLAERYRDSSDVALILLQTPMSDFKANSTAALQGSSSGFPANVAIGHATADNGPPLLLDWYGIRATPWTILISPDGTTVGNGVLLDAAEVGRLIDTLRP